WNFKLCSMIADLDDEFRNLQAISRLPFRERATALDRFLEIGPESGQLRTTRRKLPLERWDLNNDAGSRRQRDLIRVATAIAWFEAETGAPPATLADLVPRYLPALTPDPTTGKPFDYRESLLHSLEFQLNERTAVEELDLVWRIHRG